MPIGSGDGDFVLIALQTAQLCYIKCRIYTRQKVSMFGFGMGHGELGTERSLAEF